MNGFSKSSSVRPSALRRLLWGAAAGPFLTASPLMLSQLFAGPSKGRVLGRGKSAWPGCSAPDPSAQEGSGPLSLRAAPAAGRPPPSEEESEDHHEDRDAAAYEEGVVDAAVDRGLPREGATEKAKIAIDVPSGERYEDSISRRC